MTTLALKEIRDALRSRWLSGYAVLLAVVGLAAAHTASASVAGLGLQTFGRTTATLTNFCLLLAPLIAVTMGGASIAGERDRGTLDFLLAQPLERWEVLLGKYLGLLASSSIATVLGFLPAALVIAWTSGAGAVVHFMLFPGLAIVLIAAMLGVGLLVSVKSRTGVQAQGRAIFLWFAFVLLYDLVLMGTVVGVGIGAGALMGLLLLNPVDSARVLALLVLEPDLYLLGPAGAFLVGELGNAGAALLLVASLLVWTIVPLLASLWSFRLRRRTGPHESQPSFDGVKSHA